MSMDYIHNQEKVNIKQIGKTKKTKKNYKQKLAMFYNCNNYVLLLQFPSTKQ